ncbi:MAG: hypothetical protein LOY04_09960 [Rhodococcus ruber]|nr:hypothetical protein [Rhodococcus ruber]
MRWIRNTWLALSLLALAAAPASAQRFGVHANWSDDFDFGIGGRVEVDALNLITDERPLSRTFFIGTFDFPDCGFDLEDDSFDCSYWEINGNLAIPLAAADIDPYVGAGLNIARFSADYSGTVPGVDLEGSDTDVGLNLLGGLRFMLSSLSAYAEARLELGGGEQFVITGGVLVGGTGND